MSNTAAVGTRAEGSAREEQRVIFASSLGTVFEWYDFYLYATLAPFFAASGPWFSAASATWSGESTRSS